MLLIISEMQPFTTNYSDISAILDVFEMAQCENACSWTSNYVAYYHHIINRARVSQLSRSVVNKFNNEKRTHPNIDYFPFNEDDICLLHFSFFFFFFFFRLFKVGLM